jgi:uncharacterized protein YndB with AHSA1/START domain
MEKEIKASISIKASPAKVWEALTRSEYTRQYMFGCDAISDWKAGSKLEWKGQLEGQEIIFVTGNIVNIVPEKILEYTVFDPNSTTLENIPSNYLHVVYELIPQNGGTLLKVKMGDYTKVGEGEKRYNDTIQGGGWSVILEAIKKVVEQ